MAVRSMLLLRSDIKAISTGLFARFSAEVPERAWLRRLWQPGYIQPLAQRRHLRPGKKYKTVVSEVRVDTNKASSNDTSLPLAFRLAISHISTVRSGTN